MDLSKAFDTLPHELIVLKLKEYGADEATTSLIKDYLSNGFQRVRLGDTFSNWQPTCNGVVQGSMAFIIQHLHERSFICHQEVHSVDLR